MSTFFSTLLVIFGILLVSFALINIRQIFTGKEFRGTCATNNPMLKNSIGECTVCGSRPDEACKQEERKMAQTSI